MDSCACALPAASAGAGRRLREAGRGLSGLVLESQLPGEAPSGARGLRPRNSSSVPGYSLGSTPSAAVRSAAPLPVGGAPRGPRLTGRRRHGGCAAAKLAGGRPPGPGLCAPPAPHTHLSLPLPALALTRVLWPTTVKYTWMQELSNLDLLRGQGTSHTGSQEGTFESKKDFRQQQRC